MTFDDVTVLHACGDKRTGDDTGDNWCCAARRCWMARRDSSCRTRCGGTRPPPHSRALPALPAP